MPLKRNNQFIILGVVLFVILAILFEWHSNKILNLEGRYTIGTIEKIRPAGNGVRVYISFFYHKKNEERDYIEDVGIVQRLYIGKRLFIKFVPDDISQVFDFNINCQVPDSILVAPPEGWSQEWMKEHFPDCVK